MTIYKKTIELNDDIINCFEEDMLFFDIETLGLSWKYFPIYLIGCMYRRDNLGHIRLFFANTREEEKEIIEGFTDLLNGFKTLVTFNGSTFDIPYVTNRAKKHGIDSDLYGFEHLDLYKLAKRHKVLLGLNRLNQKSLEEFLGLFREDEYDGGRLIEVYKAYEKHPEEKLKHLLLLHNYEDVKGMATLLPLTNYDKLKYASLNILNYDLSNGNELLFKATSDVSIPKPIRILKEHYHIQMDGCNIRGSIPLYNGTLRYYIKNYKDYYYLPGEDAIIPKALGKTLDKELRQPACRENCFIPSQGIFLPIPSGNKIKSFINLSEKRIFNKDICNKDCFLMISGNEKDSPQNQELSEIISGYLSYCFS